MGSASVSSLQQRQLTVMVSGVPTGGSLQLVQGAVDYVGKADPMPRTAVVATYPGAALSTGSVVQPVNTSVSSYVRTQVLDSAGKVVGVSNPVWLLREVPANGIPMARAC